MHVLIYARVPLEEYISNWLPHLWERSKGQSWEGGRIIFHSIPFSTL